MQTNNIRGIKYFRSGFVQISLNIFVTGSSSTEIDILIKQYEIDKFQKQITVTPKDLILTRITYTKTSEDTITPTIFIENTSKESTPGVLRYTTSHPSWKPFYKIELKNERKLNFILWATFANKTNSPFRNTPISLVDDDMSTIHSEEDSANYYKKRLVSFERGGYVEKKQTVKPQTFKVKPLISMPVESAVVLALRNKLVNYKRAKFMRLGMKNLQEILFVFGRPVVNTTASIFDENGEYIVDFYIEKSTDKHLIIPFRDNFKLLPIMHSDVSEKIDVSVIESNGTNIIIKNTKYKILKTKYQCDVNVSNDDKGVNNSNPRNDLVIEHVKQKDYSDVKIFGEYISQLDTGDKLIIFSKYTNIIVSNKLKSNFIEVQESKKFYMDLLISYKDLSKLEIFFKSGKLSKDVYVKLKPLALIKKSIDMSNDMISNKMLKLEETYKKFETMSRASRDNNNLESAHKIKGIETKLDDLFSKIDAMEKNIKEVKKNRNALTNRLKLMINKIK